jgi:A/G-specific adenine glycosylase
VPVTAAARAAILTWFDGRGRDLPFRRTRDPYAILVSELMAQQTQVARAAAAWVSFMAAFPTVQALATASPADVLRAWRGLGYNRRATNLRLAAIAIVERHGERVPRDLASLQRLPGVGPYTARAVAALAFGEPVGPVDTNVRRVLGRILADDPMVGSAAGLQAAADAAAALGERPGDWTHALMDIGATLCAPRRPNCDACPAIDWCAYARTRSAATPAPRQRLSRPPQHSARPAQTPFRATSRWLRGRILDLLRDAPDGGWTPIAGPIGAHDAGAIRVALAALSVDGLVELDPVDPGRARLPHA